MRIIPLNCANCGAPLEVPAKTRYFTCSFCDSRLEVRHEGDAIFTETVEALREENEQLSNQIEWTRLQKSLTSLDAWWRNERERWMVQTKYGGKKLPSQSRIIMFWCIAVLCLALCFFSVSKSDQTLTAIFCMVGAMMSVTWAMVVMTKLAGYKKAKRNYTRRRRVIMEKIEEFKATLKSD